MESNELRSWLRLSLTPGIGDTTARKLLAAFGLPAEVFAQPQEALQQVASLSQSRALLSEPAGLVALLDRTLEWLQGTEAHGATHRLLTLGDPGYPAALLETADPPLMLYLVGAPTFDLSQLDRSIAIVGSRNPSAQGKIGRASCRERV